MTELDAVATAELSHALRIGLVTAGAAALVGVAWRQVRSGAAPAAGVLLAGAVLFAVGTRYDVPAEVIVSVVVLAAAGTLLDVRPRTWPLVVAVGAAAGWAVADVGGLESDGWRAAVAVGVGVGGTLVALFDRRWRSVAFATPLLVISTIGVYYTVPDTERAVLLLGAALPYALLAWPIPLAALGGGGAMATVGVMAWVVTVDGAARESAVLGGLATVGLLALEPLARLIVPDGRSAITLLRGRTGALAAAAAAHLGFVFVASRVAGLEDDARRAVSILAVTAVAGLALLALGRFLAGRSETSWGWTA